ncbi:PAS domain S-box protein, partial [Acidimicrobiaceae bacterium USS-CC1]|nr:PAS domain S-box protein [Acidiferrimicrobium australe]
LGAERLLTSVGHAVVVTDLAGAVQYWNPAAERLYGWAAADALGRRARDLLAPRLSRGTAEGILATLADGVAWTGTVQVQHSDGTLFPALVTSNGVFDDGRLVGVVGAAIGLHQALRPLLEDSPDAVLVVTPDGRVGFVSQAATRLFGWTGPELIGSDVLHLVHPGDRSDVSHRLAAADRGQHQAQCPAEWRVRGRCGWRWVEAVAGSLGDPSAHGVVLSLRDVTDRREDRERLARLSEQLQVALSSRVVIEQAKGFVAASRAVDLDEAFAVLRQYARSHNQTLHEVATAVVTRRLRP